MRDSAQDIRLSILLALALSTLICIPAKKHSQHQHPFAKSHRSSPTRLRHQGTWGSWSVWSECSRTCGGGVSEQSRECLTHTPRAKVNQVKDNEKTPLKPAHCIGLRKRYQLCNTKPCVGKLISDFRREQCAAYNSHSFAGKNYQWEPYIQVPATNRCELNCRARGFRFYATLAKQVVDGTPCDDIAPDLICVGGQCKQVGCDGVIGSEKRFDHCGVCGGDNSTCRIVSGLFTRPQLPAGYNHIASIPRGACNINITELKNSRNYLALRQLGGEYIINGNWAISWSGEYDAVGTTFTYQRDDDSSHHSECITSKGPTSEPLEIMMIYKQPNSGIKYEYTLPLRDSPSADRPFIQASPTSKAPPSRSQVRHPVTLPPLQGDLPTESTINNQLLSSPTRVRKGEGGGGRRRSRHYAWKVSGFSQCSRSCGGGTQTTIIVCVKENSLAVVADVNCDVANKPDIQTVRCNTRPCPAEWVLSEWSECSATCGEGVQTREVSCKQQISSTMQIQVSEGTCVGTPADATVRSCRLRPCITWTTSEWTKCSVQCGTGKRTRKVECVHADGSSASSSDCDSKSKPDSEESCEMGSCQRTWFYTEWSNWCSQECGEGIKTRKVFCPSSDGLPSSKEDCDPSRTPATSQSCTASSACQAKWFTGPWTQCSSSCGPGSQNRDVVCLSFSRGQYRPALEVLCSDVDRPDQERPCNLKPCGSEWYMTDWSKCSRTCDSGVQNREVKCLDDKQQPSNNCPEDTKPAVHQSCNQIECSKYMGQSDSECVDKFHNCNLVAQSRLCSYDYYRSACCNSCHKIL